MAEKVKYVFRVDIELDAERELTPEEAEKIRERFEPYVEVALAMTPLGLKPNNTLLRKPNGKD